ncbi:hypothetical protein FRC01_003977 [Tulasnella sp. 417]|nr:hypothetical protein FRC01_003977 [Tulasnella sp. 417]
MHILDLPEDVLLEIIRRLQLADVPALVQACRAFASLRSTHLKSAFDVLRLVILYDLGSEILDIPPIGAEVRKKAAIPYKFEEAMVSGLLAQDSLQRYETTVTGESVYSACLFPGGHWLVTASGNDDPDELEASLPFHLPSMKYRVWDLESVDEGLPLSPVACIAMPPDESEISGEIWLRKDDDQYRIWIYAQHRLRELVFDHCDNSLYERRSIEVSGLDLNYNIGFHGNYVFDYLENFQIVDRETNLKASFWLRPEVMDGWLRWFLAIEDDGLIILDSENRDVLHYRPNIPRWGFHENDSSQDLSPQLKILEAIPITEIPPLKKGEIHQTPSVNRPSSIGKPLTTLVRFPGHLVFLEFSSDLSVMDLGRTFTAHPFPDRPEETTPRVHAKTISGHVVAISKPFDVHVLRAGEDVITLRVHYDLEDADSTAAFVCPFGGVIGATHRMDEIRLWRADLAYGVV